MRKYEGDGLLYNKLLISLALQVNNNKKKERKCEKQTHN